MAVATETDLTTSQRDSLKKARQAFQRDNHDYAVALLMQLLKEAPRFLEGRALLREIGIKKSASASKMFKSLGSISHAPQLMKAQNAAKKNPEEALITLEHFLLNDPFHPQANALLSQIAQQLDMPETACFAHETVAKNEPNEPKNLHALGRLYLAMRDPRAKQVFEHLLNLNPHDGDALTQLKNAEALSTMMKGWEKATDYRDLIANEEVAQQLEQAGKVTKSTEGIDRLIEESKAKLAAEAGSVLHARRIAELFRQKDDFDNALAYYQHAWELGGKADAGLEKTIHEVDLKRYDALITQWEAYLRDNPQDPERDAHAATLESLRTQRQERVLTEARNRVTKYPNDLEFRFELGEALFHAGDVTNAIPELQAALRQPNARLQAMLYLALCFRAKGMRDMAAKRLEEAATEITGMDDTKKNLLYHLGLVREELGDPKAAHEAWKQIYEVDYGYRDGEIARRVEEYYKANA